MRLHLIQTIFVSKGKKNHIREVYGERIERVSDIHDVTEGQIEKPLQELIDGGQ